MKKTICFLLAAVILAACGSNDAATSDGGTSSTMETHSGHSADVPASSETGGTSHMKAMHNSMSGTMQQMKAMKLTGDADHDFAMMMKHHHQSAIDMAQSEIAGGTDVQMKQIAQEIIEEQQKEIATFDNFLQGNQPHAGGSEYGRKAMNMMTDMAEMNMESSSLDAMFASMMIPHHQDAVKMAEEYLKVSKNDELKQIANNIISSQPKEIKAFQSWLAARENNK